MFQNIKEVNESRLSNLSDLDFDFFVKETGLPRQEIDRIFKIFHEKGGDLNRHQFKQLFEQLNKRWLSKYHDISQISDFVFRAFDKDHDGLLEFKEFLEGCSALFLSRRDKKAKLEYIFGLYDINNDDCLSYEEIQAGFKIIFLMLGSEGNIDMLSKSMANETMDKMLRHEDFIQYMIDHEDVDIKLSILFE